MSPDGMSRRPKGVAVPSSQNSPAHYYNASKACCSDCPNISFKVANTVITAALRFRSSSGVSSLGYRSSHGVLGHQSSHEVRLNLYITDDTRDVESDRAFVKSLMGFVESGDSEKLKELGGLEGLAQHLHTDLARGLHIGHSQPDVLASRKRVFGENVYPRKARKTLWEHLWEACCDKTLNILMLCAALSLGFGIKSNGVENGWYDGVSMAIAVVLAIVVTAISNYGQSSSKFQQDQRDNIQVHAVRDGQPITVPIVDIVVGDIVKLKTGDQVPADGLLVQGQSLTIDESSFTGEIDYYSPDSDKQAFLRSGSKIQDGYGSMLVTGVGINTEWGRMKALMSRNSYDEERPLQARLREATTLIGKVSLSVALVVLVVSIILYFTGKSSTSNDAKLHAWQSSATDHVMDAMVHIFSVVVTIVVVAVPECLPLTVTLTLAYSMKKMMLDETLYVRRLTACETMGCATTICSDKTGTLTLNQMTVVESWIAGKTSSSEEQEKFMKSLPRHLQGLLFQGIAQTSSGSVITPADNSSQQVEVMGSPTEKALLWWGLKAGMSFHDAKAESTILQEETFNSAKKCAGVAVKNHRGKQQILVHWKGAAEIILSMCNKWMDNKAHERQMSIEKRRELEAMIEKMASRGLRCVALATCTIALRDGAKVGQYGWRLPEADLTLLAVVGMKDPCRPEAKAFVDAIKAAGVKVRMVTGDNLATAKAIALECGILETETDQLAVVEAAVLQSWTESERKQKLPRVAVVARARPLDKLLVVKTLQSMGDVVAVMGDGTDDAPALYKADVGLSMGNQGTEVAKESSDIIILDDNFESVVRVVRWGRCVNFNIQKFLQFQLTVNVTTLAVNLVAVVSSVDVPMTIGHVLWVNLIFGTVGALALATEPPMDVLMKEPSKEPRITYTMWRNVGVLTIYQVVILRTLQFKGVDLLHLSGDHDADIFNRTTIFNIFVFCQIFNEMNAR